MPRLTRPAFRAFLASKKPTYRFRIKGDLDWDSCCPLAIFLGTSVQWATYDDSKKKLPVWAMKFTEKVDNSTGYLCAITAKRALAILDSLK